jgi:hypothetical protein
MRAGSVYVLCQCMYQLCPLVSKIIKFRYSYWMDFIDSWAKTNFSRKGLHHKFICTDLKNTAPLHVTKHKELGSLVNRINRLWKTCLLLN